MTTEELQAIKEMMEEVTKASEDRMGQRISCELKPVHEKLDELKEEAAITRHSVNLLLKWAEKADRSVNVGLYDS